MRHKLCPRCDSILDKSGHCSVCGYQVRIACKHCGQLNIPKAKYCGGCGTGTTIAVRYRRKVNSLFSPSQQIKIKRFFTGMTFGTLFALFAFSSMGMKYRTPEVVTPENEATETLIEEQILNSTILKSVTSDLEAFSLSRGSGKLASSSELGAVIDILIRNLNHIAYRINKSKRPLDSAMEYIEQQKCIKQTEETTRGNSALMFFAYISDLFDLKYRDYTQGSTYSDVPRFNIMDAPTSALKAHNIKLEADREHFGVNEPISIRELCEAAKQVAVMAVQRANEKAPDLSAPPQIIIE